MYTAVYSDLPFTSEEHKVLCDIYFWFVQYLRMKHSVTYIYINIIVLYHTSTISHLVYMYMPYPNVHLCY